MKCDPEGVLVMLRSNRTSLMRLTDAKNPRGAGHVRVFFVFLSSLKIFPFFFLLLKIRYSKKFLKVIYSMAQISLCLITYTKLFHQLPLLFLLFLLLLLFCLCMLSYVHLLASPHVFIVSPQVACQNQCGPKASDEWCVSICTLIKDNSNLTELHFGSGKS